MKSVWMNKQWMRVCLLAVTVAALVLGGVDLRKAEAAGHSFMRIGVNDDLTEVHAESVEYTYYVPLRETTAALGLTLSGSAEVMAVTDKGRTLLRLKPAAQKAVLPDGTQVEVPTHPKNGQLMVPVRLAQYLGYKVTLMSDRHVIRLTNASAALSGDAFYERHRETLKQEEQALLQAEKRKEEERKAAERKAAEEAARKEQAKQPEALKAPGAKTVYLTFDDGPTASTGKLLDILAKYDAKATFFMLGNNISQHPSQVKRLVKEGHAPGLHGMTHRKEKFYGSPAAALKEMNDDNRSLKQAAGVSTKLIRTPYGSKPYFTRTYRDKVLSAGYRLWDWNVDSEDWKHKDNSDAIYQSVMKQVAALERSKTAPVILMHDQKATLKALPRILEALQKKGYRFEVLTAEQKPLNFWKDVR